MQATYWAIRAEDQATSLLQQPRVADGKPSAMRGSGDSGGVWLATRALGESYAPYANPIFNILFYCCSPSIVCCTELLRFGYLTFCGSFELFDGGSLAQVFEDASLQATERG